MQHHHSLYDDKMFNQHYLNIFDEVSNTYNHSVDNICLKNEIYETKGIDSSYSFYHNEYPDGIIDDHIEYMEDNFIAGDHFSSSTDSASLDMDSPQCMDYNAFSPNSTPSSPDSTLTYTSQSSQYSSHTNSPTSHTQEHHLSHSSTHISQESQTAYSHHKFSPENESLASKPTSSYYLYSQFKQDQLQEIMKQQQKDKDTNKDLMIKIKPDPIMTQSDNTNLKIAPHSFVIPDTPFHEPVSKGFQESFTPNQTLIATIAQNSFPHVQGNTIIAIHPVQTLYPLSSSQITSILNAPHMNNPDFKYFDGIKSKKRCRISSPFEKERRVRPKVIPEKGAIQCKGYNRKKKTQCKNAALMEYIGPRPLYCAEHIDLDPDCLYTKCKSPFNKTRDDEKGCREVVLKEFTFCHKHYSLAIEEMATKGEGRKEAEIKLERAKSLLENLESEAIKAKRTDPDLFQRKHKLIPKFQQVIRTLQKFLQTN